MSCDGKLIQFVIYLNFWDVQCIFVEIQVLMGSLLYLRQGIQNSPYAHLFDPIEWTEIADTFIHDACTLLGLSVGSPLSIVYVYNNMRIQLYVQSLCATYIVICAFFRVQDKVLASICWSLLGIICIVARFCLHKTNRQLFLFIFLNLKHYLVLW